MYNETARERAARIHSPWTQPARVPGEPRHPRIAYVVLDVTGEPYTITTSALIAAQCAAEIGGRVTVL